MESPANDLEKKVARTVFWFVAIRSMQKGPFAEAQLEPMVADGTLSHSTLVWCDGMAAWAPAATTRLARFFDSPPPIPDFASESSLPRPQEVTALDAPTVFRGEAAAEETEAGWKREPRPWMRYFARIIDITIAGAVFGVATSSFVPVEVLGNAVVANVAATLVLMVSEPFLLAHWGWTPGKSLLGVRVRRRDGRRLSLGQAFWRAWGVAFSGMGLGIPIVSFITLLVAYNRLTKTGITSWDENDDLQVTHKDPGLVKGTVAALIIIAIFAWLFYERLPKR